MSKTKFIVAEPVFLVRKGLVNVINELPNASVIGELELTKSITKLVTGTSNYVDVLVISSDLLDETSQFSFKRLKTKHERVVIIVVTKDVKDIPIELKSFFSEIVLLSDSKSTVHEKFKKILNSSNVAHVAHQVQVLSEREAQILKDVALGLSNKEIADKNFISPHTVITHRKNITKKLGIKTVSGLTIYAILNKLIGIDEGN
ncbi:MAG: LuxR C-terminal-related transcriptional regulator [Bacteroidales bacterium]|nr:LuxR C-terminal-related transcriptional regulator [Bacteroidales bacterium]MDD4385959.1 LuxR C-terminal-related transcriptional regulator [Bacteroidales bacterium]